MGPRSPATLVVSMAVIARLSQDQIIAGLAKQRIFTGAAAHRVAAGPADQRIVAPVARKHLSGFRRRLAAFNGRASACVSEADCFTLVLRDHGRVEDQDEGFILFGEVVLKNIETQHLCILGAPVKDRFFTRQRVQAQISRVRAVQPLNLPRNRDG